MAEPNAARRDFATPRYLYLGDFILSHEGNMHISHGVYQVDRKDDIASFREASNNEVVQIQQVMINSALRTIDELNRQHERYVKDLLEKVIKMP